MFTVQSRYIPVELAHPAEFLLKKKTEILTSGAYIMVNFILNLKATAEKLLLK